LLVFRDQPVADDVQAAFSRAFGPLELTKVSSLGQNTFYSRLTNTANGKVVPPDHRQVLVAKANALWHTDSSFKKTPALASVLTARVLPEDGGETEFTSTRLAWERLPRDMQARLKDAVATHSYANSRDQIHPDLATEIERRALPPVRWRLNWRNPANDRRALYVASHAYAIDGMDERDARQLLAQLVDEATRREFVYSHRWRQGDAVMWDNRAMLHRGRPWDYARERTMVRTTISATVADGLDEVKPPVLH
jgi:alpha-ketoglutarate-dependent 2,4-dichlorophenoxyacetate dioxygenase